MKRMTGFITALILILAIAGATASFAQDTLMKRNVNMMKQNYNMMSKKPVMKKRRMMKKRRVMRKYNRRYRKGNMMKKSRMK